MLENGKLREQIANYVSKRQMKRADSKLREQMSNYVSKQQIMQQKSNYSSEHMTNYAIFNHFILINQFKLF